MQQPVSHPVYAALNKPLLLKGVDWRVFFVAVFGALGAFGTLRGIVGVCVAILIFLFVWGAGLIATRRDPQFFSLFLCAAKLQRRYDASL